MSEKIKGCITYISSRKKCIAPSIKSLWDRFNHKYDYPVYIHYFDEIYDDEEFRNKIRSETSENVHFISIPYKSPDSVKEEDMFYNRQDVWYARTQFPIGRKGYLHMCHFMSNYYGYPETKFEDYDIIMSLDDESMFLKDLPYDPFEIMSQRPEPMGALKVVDQKLRKPHQGNLDTRINLWNFVQAYMKYYSVTPESDFMKNLLKDPEAEKNFHEYLVADSYVVKSKMFLTEEWKQWIAAVNKYGGIYKYRWGDNDINSLFYLIHVGDFIYDLKTVDDGYHDQGALRHLQDYAPGVKDLER